MSHSVITDARIYLGTFDLSGDANSVDLAVGTKGVEDNYFGKTYHSELPGLRHWSMGAAGLLNYADDAADEVLHGKWNRTAEPVSVQPTGVDGEVAYFGTGFQAELARNGQVGEALKWTLGGASAGLLVRGAVMHTKASRAATGNGTGFQLGAVTAGKSLYSVIHVFGAPGTSLIVTVQSDDNSGFTSATTRITHATVTTTTSSELLSVAGSITDDWWRIVYTITGAGPYVLAAAAGIV
jgi:hypothetical protein